MSFYPNSGGMEVRLEILNRTFQRPKIYCNGFRIGSVKENFLRYTWSHGISKLERIDSAI